MSEQHILTVGRLFLQWTMLEKVAQNTRFDPADPVGYQNAMSDAHRAANALEAARRLATGELLGRMN